MKKGCCWLLALWLCCTAPLACALQENPVDLDLSIINDFVAYDQIYQVISNPQQYEGQIIRLRATLDSYQGKNIKIKSIFGESGSGSEYFVCTIQDAYATGACCGARILELEIEALTIPEEALAWGEDVIVTGRVSITESGGKTILYLSEATLERVYELQK